MGELYEFCARVLGSSTAAIEAVREARASPGADRVSLLAAAARACRGRGVTGDSQALLHGSAPAEGERLAEAVARELGVANARLPERQREALALRELLRLSYDEISGVMGIEPVAVAPLLARARLNFRAQLRGVSEPENECEDRERALRALASRHDSEPLTETDENWLVEHVVECQQCNTTHAAMLEASVCYRAWRADDRRAGSTGVAGVRQAVGADAVQ